jgi:hypothetical protein
MKRGALSNLRPSVGTLAIRAIFCRLRMAGTASRRLDYDRALCRGFLEELTLVPGGRLPARDRLCDRSRGTATRTSTHLVLFAPTWRGPLSAMMSGRKPIQGRIRKLIHAPVIGELPYRLNVARPVVRDAFVYRS